MRVYLLNIYSKHDTISHMTDQYFSYEQEPEQTYNKLEHMKVFLGCIIKSLYDEERITIKEKFGPIRISHCGKKLYGMVMTPKPNHLFMLKNIIDIGDIDLFTYNKILLENNLTCNENFAYLEKNLYPIDPPYIYDYIPFLKNDSFFDDESDRPLYQRIKSVNMFFLTPE